MKIISWNVNGIRAIQKKGFTQWLLSSNADVVCIQETKASRDNLDEELLSPHNENVSYNSYFSSAQKAGYSGTAIYLLSCFVIL